MNSLSPDAGLDADSLSIGGFGFIMQLTHAYKQIHKWACYSSQSFQILNIWYARSSSSSIAAVKMKICYCYPTGVE